MCIVYVLENKITTTADSATDSYTTKHPAMLCAISFYIGPRYNVIMALDCNAI